MEQTKKKKWMKVIVLKTKIAGYLVTALVAGILFLHNYKIGLLNPLESTRHQLC